MTSHKQTFAATLTGVAKLPDELRLAPIERQEKKVRSSMMGLLFIIIGVIILGVALIISTRFALDVIARPEAPTLAQLMPTFYLVGGIGAVGLANLVFGALISDYETVGPVFKAIVGLAIKAKKA